MLLHVMEARGLTHADLIGIFGSSQVAFEVVNNQREISKEQILALGEFFQVDSGLFT